MVLEIDSKKYESKNERVRRRSSFPMRSEFPHHYSTTLSLQITESVNKVCMELQPESPPKSIPPRELLIRHSPIKTNGSNNRTGYREYSSPSRVINSATFTVPPMEIVNPIPNPKSSKSKPDDPPDPKEDKEDRSMKRPPENDNFKICRLMYFLRSSVPSHSASFFMTIISIVLELRKNKIENVPVKTSPSPPKSNNEEPTTERIEKRNEADGRVCDSGTESASPEKDPNKQQSSTELATTMTPAKNGKGKFGGLKKRKSLDKSSRKDSLRNEITADDEPSPPCLSQTSTPSSPSLRDRRKSSSSLPVPLSLSLSVQEDGNSISSIVEYEGAKKIPKKANIETMRAMGLTEERKPKLSSRASFKMWKRSALQYIKSHASNVNKGKMYRMNACEQIKGDDALHYKSETADDQTEIPANGDNQLCLQSHSILDVNYDLSPTDEHKSNCSPIYKCYQNPANTSPYSDEKIRKWRRVRRAFSELYPSRCIDPRMTDDERNMNRKSGHKISNRKSMLSMSKTNSQFDLRTVGAIEIDANSFVSDSFHSEIMSLQTSSQNKEHTDSSDKRSSKDDKSKLDKNASFGPQGNNPGLSTRLEVPSIPLKTNGHYQTAPHRIDLQKYVINPNRENCRRSSLADIPTSNSSTQREQHSKSLESSRTEPELKEETVSPNKEKPPAFETVVPDEELSSISRETSCSTFQLINVSPDSTSSASTYTYTTASTSTSNPTTNTSTSQDASSYSTGQISSCTTSNNLTTSSSGSETTPSDDATISPTFEEYAKAHGGIHFGRGLAAHRDHQIMSRGVTANLIPTQGRVRRSSVTIVNRSTSPINCEMQKESALPKLEIILNPKLQTTSDGPQHITRSSFPEYFRRTQEISCRLLSTDEATATRNTHLIPSKHVSPGSVTTRYPRNTKEVGIEPKENDLNVCLSPAQKSQLDEPVDKKETENERHVYEEVSESKDTTSYSNSKNVINDQEEPPMLPPRRRLKEKTEGMPSITPGILKKNVSAINRPQSPDTQEWKNKKKKEPDNPSTKIPSSRRGNNQDKHVGNSERPSSPFTARRISKPASPLPKRDLSPRPMPTSKSMPSSPDLNSSRDLRIAGGVPSNSEITQKRTRRVTSHIPSSPDISSKISRPFANRQPSSAPASPGRSRITTEETANSKTKEYNEKMVKDPDTEKVSVAIKADSSSRILFSEAAPLKNSRMTSKQVNPDISKLVDLEANKQVNTDTNKQVNTDTAKNGRMMTPKKVNVNTGLQLATRHSSTKALNNDPSKNSRIPVVSKSMRPDVIPKKSGRLAMNRLVNPNVTTDKCLKTANIRAARSVPVHGKYSQHHSEETFIPSSLGSLPEQHEMLNTVRYEGEIGSQTHHAASKPLLSKSTGSAFYIDLENDLTSHESGCPTYIGDPLVKSPRNKSDSHEVSDESETADLEISRDEIDQIRKRLLEKTMSCDVESGSPTRSPTKSSIQQMTSGSIWMMAPNCKVEESPTPVGEIKRQDATAQTVINDIKPRERRVLSVGSALVSSLKQDMAAQIFGNELQTGHSVEVCGTAPVPVMTRPHQIKMGGAALRTRSTTDMSDGTKYTSRPSDQRWEISNYEHFQQIMVVEEGQARLYDLKPASCQSIQVFSPNEYSLASTTSNDLSYSTDPHMTESASVDHNLGDLAKTRYRYNLSNSMAGGLDSIAQSNTEQSMFENASNSWDSANLESIPRMRRAASLSNIEFPSKAMDKKNRKRSRLSTLFDIFQRKKKPVLPSDHVDLPTHFRMIGRILEMCLDGTRIIELTQPPHGLCGIYMTRMKRTFGYGIYVSRFCDGYPEKMFSGLLAIGDQILEINGVPTDKITVDEAHDMVSARDTLILRVMPDPANYRVSTLPR